MTIYRKTLPQFSQKRFFKSLAVATTGLASFSGTSVFADTDHTANATNKAPLLEQTLVIGQGASMDNAIQKQRQADAIKSVISADAVAQLPDDNVAEAMQRLPGVTIERDQGEGRFVSVRGLGPDLNSVSINGAVIPSPNAGSRAVALDVVPSELVQTLSVVKAATPDMDANSLGGNIEVESLSGFDHQDSFFTAKVEGGYDSNVEKTSPKVSGAYSNRFGGSQKDTFAIAAAISWQDRDFGSDNIETGGAWDGDQLEELEQRDYQINRERLGLGLNLDYKWSENSSVYLRSLYSEFSDTETRNAAGLEFEDPLAVNQTGPAEGWRELKERKETQKIQSYVIGGDWKRGKWTLDAQLGWSKSSEDTPGHIAGAGFEGSDSFGDTGFNTTRLPVAQADEAFYSANQFELDEVEWAEQYTSDNNSSFKLNAARQYDLSGWDSSVKFGGKYSTREKDNDTTVWKYDDFESNGIEAEQRLLSYHQGPDVDYSLGRYGPSIESLGLKQIIAGMSADDFYDEEESRIEDFVIQEDLAAAYIMNTMDKDQWRIIYGVRYEATELNAQGTQLEDDTYSPRNIDTDYDHLLPAIHVRYKAGENTQFRAAWTNTVVRPTFDQLMPGFAVDDNEAEFGNPELEALESSNIDFGVEHFLGRAGILSAFVFYKQIDNFVYETDVSSQSPWTEYSEAITYVNGDSADLYGFELAWSQQLVDLPAPWDNLLMGINFTSSRSSTEINNGNETREIDLPYQADMIGNALLGWENETFSIRLTANHKSSYLQEVAVLDGAPFDLYLDSQTFLDLGAHYYITPQLRLSVEAKNMTDEAYYVYTGNKPFNAQYEEYGPTYKLGITFTAR